MVDFFSWEISAIDTASNSISSNAFAFGFSDQISVSPDGTRVYETGESFPDGGSIAVRDAQTLAILDQAPLGDFFYSVTAHPNGEWLFLGSHTEVVRLNANTLKLEWRKTISWAGQFENLLISTDGTRLYAPALPTGKTHVLDTTTGTELGEIPLSGRGISQHPLGHLIYIVLQTNNRVGIVDANTLEVLDVVPVGDNPVSAGADFVTPILCGPSLYGEDAGNGASLTAAGEGTTGSTLTLGYAQPPADASYAFSYVGPWAATPRRSWARRCCWTPASCCSPRRAWSSARPDRSSRSRSRSPRTPPW
jgi:YVTN family beta-propeller protein